MNKEELNNKLAELYGLEPKLGKLHLIDDSARMFELALANDIWIQPYNHLGFIYAHFRCNHELNKASYREHESPQAAARYAIAMALIKMKESK